MSDGMFNNSLAAKKLQLQMADWKAAHGSIEDVNTQIATLQGSIENLQSRGLSYAARVLAKRSLVQSRRRSTHTRSSRPHYLLAVVPTPTLQWSRSSRR